PPVGLQGLIGRVRQVDIDMRAFVHEFGHARYGLDDEYANDDTSACPESERSAVAQYPNCSTDETGLRWQTLVPELYARGTLSIVEGGSGYAKKVWRARFGEHDHCRMKQTRTMDFCEICQAVIRRSNKKPVPFHEPQWVAPNPARTNVITLDPVTTKTDED